MKDKYCFLKDPRVLSEIRKHKWIESQKRGKDIGFASASLDWIKKYGKAWKSGQYKAVGDDAVFAERRKFRRFALVNCVELIKNGAVFAAEAVNISFLGLAVRTEQYACPGEEIHIRLPLACRKEEGIVLCKGVINRIFPVEREKYELFLRFDDHSRSALKNCSYFQK